MDVRDMTVEQKDKQLFVKGTLETTIRCAFTDVVWLNYRVIGSEEFVDVRFTNGYNKTACVTGDSMAAIVKDVIKAIER